MGAILVHLRKLLRELQIISCVNISSQLQNSCVLTCWDLLCEKVQMLLVVEKKSRQLHRVSEEKLWENKLGSGSRKKCASRVIPTKSAKQISRSRRDISSNFSQYSCRVIFGTNLLCSFWKSWRESPSSWRCFVVSWTSNLSYYLTRWKLHRVWISNASELLRWFETDVFDCETETCQRSWLRNLQNQRSKKGKQKEKRVKSRRGRDGGGRRSSSSLHSCKQHFALNFFQCWSVRQQSANLKLHCFVCAQILHFQQLQGSHLWIQGSFALRGVRLWSISWWNYGSAFVWTSFTRRRKMLNRPDGFMFYGKMGVDFFFTSELLYPKMKIRLRLIRARPNF